MHLIQSITRRKRKKSKEEEEQKLKKPGEFKSEPFFQAKKEKKGRRYKRGFLHHNIF